MNKTQNNENKKNSGLLPRVIKNLSLSPLPREEQDELLTKLHDLKAHRVQFAKQEQKTQEELKIEQFLFERNVGLVRYFVNKWCNQNYWPTGNYIIQYDDLLSEASIALLEAIRKHEPKLGCALSSFAKPIILWRISGFLYDNSTTIRVPRNRRAELRKYNSEADDEKNLREFDKYLDSARRVSTLVSMDTGGSKKGIKSRGVADEENIPMEFFNLESLIDSGAPDPYQIYEKAELSHVIDEALSVLTPREQTVLRMRYGLGASQDHTLEQVGEKIGVTRERVRQIEARAVRVLKHPSNSGKMKEFLPVDEEDKIPKRLLERTKEILVIAEPDKIPKCIICLGEIGYDANGAGSLDTAVQMMKQKAYGLVIIQRNIVGKHVNRELSDLLRRDTDDIRNLEEKYFTMRYSKTPRTTIYIPKTGDTIDMYHMFREMKYAAKTLLGEPSKAHEIKKKRLTGLSSKTQMDVYGAMVLDAIHDVPPNSDFTPDYIAKKVSLSNKIVLSTIRRIYNFPVRVGWERLRKG